MEYLRVIPMKTFLALAVLLLAPFATLEAAEAPQAMSSQNDMPLNAITPDLTVPLLQDAEPAAGKRVRTTTAAWQGTAVHHALYLPRDWRPGAKLPVLVEYPGNGGYRNPLGDISDGTVEGCKLGYGLSAGEGFIWISMPFVEMADGTKRNALRWWGNVEETKRYCIATVRDICARFGGDADRVVLCGFSRGAIACNFIGLHDDEISSLWRAFFCHSHYDGVREKWPYPGADRASALTRLARLHGRPQWISHEGSVAETETYLRAHAAVGRFTFAALPFPNHTDTWILRDLPLRRQARAWLREVVFSNSSDSTP